MDFPTAFVALRDRFAAAQDESYVVCPNAAVAGRTAALTATLAIAQERKLMGIMPMGSSGHAHEYRLLFAAPALDERALADWWAYAEAAEQTLVQPDAAHDFSLVSLILVTDEVPRAVQKKIKRLSGGRRFVKPQAGWSSINLAVVDLSAGCVYANSMGAGLKNVLTPLLGKEK